MSAEENDQTIVVAPAPWISQNIAAARRCPKCGLEVSDNMMVCPVDNTAIFEAPGNVLADTYEFISVSGWGGMSVIYKARQRESGRIVAIKMLHSLLMTEQSLRRFQQEAKAIMSLRHPNIITVHDFGVSEHGQPFMVMDFIEGKTLADVIKESGGLSLEASLPRFIQLCDALDHAHSVGVLHRDLKPSNVMISKLDGNFEDARIVDFGIAKLLDKEGENKDIGHLTQTGELFGSPLYMSPEQCRGSSVDARTDIYSMGCVMYETLTGRPPFMGATIVETLMMQMTETPHSLTNASNGKRFSNQTEEVIAKTLAKSPDDRYQTMEQLVMALMSIQPNRQADSGQLRAGMNKRLAQIPRFVYETGAAFILLSIALGVWWQNYSNHHFAISKEAHDKQNVEMQLLTKSTKEEAVQYQNLKKLLTTRREDIDDTVLKNTCKDGDLHLEELDLNNTQVGDGGTKFLRNQKSLKRVYLDNTKVSDGTVSVLSHLPDLEKMSLRNAHLSGFAFDRLPEPKNLWGIYLSGSRATGNRSLFYITLLPALAELDVTGTHLTDEGCQVLHRTNLRKFWASDTKFGDEGMHSLQRSSNLSDLYVGNSKVSDKGLGEIKNASGLKELDISSTEVTDKGMQYLTRFPQLDSLRLAHLPITDTGAEVFKNLQKLQRLNIDSTKVTDKTILILSKLPILRELNLNNVQFSDHGIEALSHSSSLSQLNLTSTKVTDAGLKHLENLKTLKTLVLVDCPRLTLTAIRQFKKNRPTCGVFVIEPTGTF